MSNCSHENQCCHTLSSCSQTLDELEFERGIWQAAIDGDIDKIKKLLNKNVNVNVTDSAGYTALHYAARNGHCDTVEFLIQQGACVNCQTKSGKDTPLHRAAYIGNKKIVELLLKNSADAMLQNTDGQTCLHKAAQKGHQVIVEILMCTYPSLVNIIDNKGRKPTE